MTYSTVVVGSDGSESSLRAVDRAVEIATEMRALLIVACAYDPVSPREAAMANRSMGDTRFTQVRGTAAAEAALSQATRHAEEAGGQAVTGVLMEGPAAEALLAVAEQRAGDLVVVGNRGVNTLSGRLLGSVASDVVQRAACDVLVVHTVNGGRS